MELIRKHDRKGAKKRRDRHEIVGEILNTAREGKIKTHIMYKAKLSFYQVQEYLPLLIEKGHLEATTIKQKKQDITIYKTTKKGLGLLNGLESTERLWYQ